MGAKHAMTDFPNNLSVFFTIWFWVKAILVAVSVIFLVFSLIVWRQVHLMSSYLETELAPLLKLTAVGLIAGVALLLFLVVVLI